MRALRTVIATAADPRPHHLGVCRGSGGEQCQSRAAGGSSIAEERQPKALDLDRRGHVRRRHGRRAVRRSSTTRTASSPSSAKPTPSTRSSAQPASASAFAGGALVFLGTPRGEERAVGDGCPGQMKVSKEVSW